MTAPIRNLDLKLLSRLWFTGSITEVELHARFGIRASDPVIQALRADRRIEDRRTPTLRPFVRVTSQPVEVRGEDGAVRSVVVEDEVTSTARDAVRFALATLRLGNPLTVSDMLTRFGPADADLAKRALMGDDLITVSDEGVITARTIYAIDTDEAQAYLATTDTAQTTDTKQPPASDPNAFPAERLNALGDKAWETVYQLIADTDTRGGRPAGETPTPALAALLDAGWAERNPDSPSLVRFRAPMDADIRRTVGDDGFRRVVKATAAVVMLLSERANSLDILRQTYGDQITDLATVRLANAVIRRVDKGWSLLPKGQRPAFFTEREKAKLREQIAEARRRKEAERQREEADRRAAELEQRRREDPAFAELVDRVDGVDRKLTEVRRDTRQAREGTYAIYEKVEQIADGIAARPRGGRVYAQPTENDVALRILAILLVEGHKTKHHFTSQRFKGKRQALVGPALDLLSDCGAVTRVNRRYMLVDPTAFGVTAAELRESYEATRKTYASRMRQKATEAVDSVRDSQFVASVKSRIGGSAAMEALDA